MLLFSCTSHFRMPWGKAVDHRIDMSHTNRGLFSSNELETPRMSLARTLVEHYSLTIAADVLECSAQRPRLDTPPGSMLHSTRTHIRRTNTSRLPLYVDECRSRRLSEFLLIRPFLRAFYMSHQIRHSHFLDCLMQKKANDKKPDTSNRSYIKYDREETRTPNLRITKWSRIPAR